MRTRFALMAIALVAWLWCFWPLVSGQRVLAFRDAGYLYYPLFNWIQDQWSAGQVPLWNPQDGLGVPVAGDATSSLFYPGKLVFFAPFFSFPARMGLYVGLHVLLAGFGTYWFSRALKLSCVSAAFVSIAYAFSGPLLSQTGNVVYLVGAAWLPWSALALWKIVQAPRVAWAVCLAAALAMMVTGGDPQMAYHVGLMAALLLAVVSVRRTCMRDGQPCLARALSSLRDLCLPAACLAAAALLGLALSAVQVLPSARWSAGSERASYVEPRTVYEIPRYLNLPQNQGWAGVGAGLLGEPKYGHHEHLYQFSLPPWTMCELVWPNATGRMYPVHRRWADALPGADRVWFPSLYLGAATLVLALCSFSLARGWNAAVWLSWAALLFSLGSFGWYGLGWLVDEVLIITGYDRWDVGPPVGGIYWLMVTVLPGYVMFRYPAKLFVVAAFATCVLAGIGLDKIPTAGRRRFGSLALIVLLTSVVLLAGTFVLAPTLREQLQHAPADDAFGPLSVAGSLVDIRLGLLQTIVVLACSAAILRFGQSQRAWIALVALLALELTIANRWLLGSVPSAAFSRDGAGVPWSEEWTQGAPTRLAQTFELETQPLQWQTTRSASRLEEIVQWSRWTAFPKFHLLDDTHLLRSFSSIEQAGELPFGNRWQLTPRSGPSTENATRQRQLALLGSVGHVISLQPNEEGDIPDYRLIGTFPNADSQMELYLWESTRRLPKAWIVQSVDVFPEMRERNHVAERLRQFEIWHHGNQERDFHLSAAVETDDPAVRAKLEALAPVGEAACEVLEYRPGCVVLEARLQSAGLVVISEAYAGGWRARVRSEGQARWRDAGVLRTNQMLQGIHLEAGRHRVELNYRPVEVVAGAWISAASMLSVVVFGVYRTARRRSALHPHLRSART